MIISWINPGISHQNRGEKNQNKPIDSTCNLPVPESWESTSPQHPLRHGNEQVLSQKRAPRGSKQATSPCFIRGNCIALLELTLQRWKPTSITRAFSEEGGNGMGGQTRENNRQWPDCASPLSGERARKQRRGEEWFSLGSFGSWTADPPRFWPWDDIQKKTMSNGS